ncbi:Ndufs4, NADH dehydrogenase Fe-S protein 4 [Lentinula raphanica]|nr:Ndufs4, NADH dehydrogenase Fe-S protein 4 [Lentinula raphanica]
MSLLRTSLAPYRRNILQTASRTLSTGTGGQSVPSGDKESSEIVAPPPPRDVMTADVVSGAPPELRHRSVRIYQPTRNTMQSGPGKGERWRIDFDVLLGGGRWENPLMGWASSADYMQGTRMSFRSKEDAIHFAEKQGTDTLISVVSTSTDLSRTPIQRGSGWDYYVQNPEVKKIPPKNYAENYLYRKDKLRIMRTK